MSNRIRFERTETNNLILPMPKSGADIALWAKAHPGHADLKLASTRLLFAAWLAQNAEPDDERRVLTWSETLATKANVTISRHFTFFDPRTIVLTGTNGSAPKTTQPMLSIDHQQQTTGFTGKVKITALCSPACELVDKILEALNDPNPNLSFAVETTTSTIIRIPHEQHDTEHDTA